MSKKIGIVGYGALGNYLANKVVADPALELEFVHDTDPKRLSGLKESQVLPRMDDLKDKRPDLVVEVAHSDWVKAFAPAVLEHTDLLILSVTAFAERGLKEKLDAVAKAHGTSYYISHGALVAMDGIRDGIDMIESISITTTKHPDKLGIKEKVSTRTVLYEGPTRKACELYPRNVNVHASLALHGLGFDKTVSKVIADPAAETMRHLIEVRGPGIAWDIDIQSKPIGAVSGAYTPESIYQTVKRICGGAPGMKFV